MGSRRRLRVLGAVTVVTAAAGCAADAPDQAGPVTVTAPPVTITAPPPKVQTAPPVTVTATPSSPDQTTAPRSTTPPSPTPSATGDAAQALESLPVKGRAPQTGYDRDLFGQSWTDDVGVQGGRNGCDTRNDILRRDLRGVGLKPTSNGCTVLTGTLRDPFSGDRLGFERGPQSAEVQVDHLVALSNAWQTGAQGWSAQKRQDFANDPLNLLAVRGDLNAQKGDGDAATWLPPRKAFRCDYVARQIAVKARYGLWVTPPEGRVKDSV